VERLAAHTFGRVALTSDYLNRLLQEVRSGLGGEQVGVEDVSLEHGTNGPRIRMVASGRRLSYEVDEAAYHYEPDGTDPSRHATWLVQLFDEEAR
jgi:hypothetical protein